MGRTRNPPPNRKRNHSNAVIESEEQPIVDAPVVIVPPLPNSKPTKYALPQDLETLDKFLDLYNYEVLNLNVNKIAYQNLLAPLTSLNGMIGMHKLKQEVLIMTLHYLRNVPEEFTQIMEKRYSAMQNQDFAYNADEDFHKMVYKDYSKDLEISGEVDDELGENCEDLDCENCYECKSHEAYEKALMDEARKAFGIKRAHECKEDSFIDDEADDIAHYDWTNATREQLCNDARRLALSVLINNLRKGKMQKNNLDEDKDKDDDDLIDDESSSSEEAPRSRKINRSQKRKCGGKKKKVEETKPAKGKKTNKPKPKTKPAKKKVKSVKKSSELLSSEESDVEEKARKIVEEATAAADAAKKEQDEQRAARKRARDEKEEADKFQKGLEDALIEVTVNGLDMMHTIICGSPGTGKSHVAQYIGAIYAAFGFLKPNKFHKIAMADLIAPFVGQTTDKTRKICQKSLGGVLFLDEAYALGSSKGDSDYGREAIDTLTDYLTSHKHDFVMIVAGYENELDTRFFSLNTGLRRRFQWKFTVENYSAGELQQIFNKMVSNAGYEFAEPVPTSWFATHYNRFSNFGGSMESLLAKVKYAHTKRSILLDNTHKNKLNQQDMDAGLRTYIEHTETEKNISHLMMFI